LWYNVGGEQPQKFHITETKIKIKGVLKMGKYYEKVKHIQMMSESLLAGLRK